MSETALSTPPIATRIRAAWREYAPQLRYWLVPLFLSFVLVAPLMRAGAPLTQMGLLPFNDRVAGFVAPELPDGTNRYNDALARGALFLVMMVGVAGRIAWGAHGWWVASLGATLPMAVSMLYQRGDPTTLLMWTMLPLGVSFFLGKQPAKEERWVLNLSLIIPAFVFVAAVVGLWLAEWRALRPYQLLLTAWAEPTDAYEWVSAPSWQVGIVPMMLGVTVALLAYPRRAEPVAHRALILVALAALFLLLTLLPGPALLWLLAALTLLVVAAGSLPLLDERFANIYAQLGILALALIAVYPALQPAWLTPPDARPVSAIFGDTTLWMAYTDVTREGEQVAVDVWWQALKPPPQDYSVFVHYVNAQGETVAQADALLADSENRPSSQFTRGYIVQQRYAASIPADATEIRIGLYDNTTLQRLSMTYVTFGETGEFVTLPLPTE